MATIVTSLVRRHAQVCAFANLRIALPTSHPACATLQPEKLCDGMLQRCFVKSGVACTKMEAHRAIQQLRGFFESSKSRRWLKCKMHDRVLGEAARHSKSGGMMAMDEQLSAQ